MGKTCVIRKMEAEAPPDKLPVYQDLENVRAPQEFVEIVWEKVETYLSRVQRRTYKVRQFFNEFGDLQLKGFKLPKVVTPHWKTILVKTIEDLVENQDRQVILLWDEIPYMLGNIGSEAAMEVLDTLRSLRQTYPAVRMVYTGSIGLHHVISSLRQKSYANAPINDMYQEDVPPLSAKDAQELAWQLLKAEKIATSNPEQTATDIANAVNGIPFYIHHIIAQLKNEDKLVDREVITQTVRNLINNPRRRWDMDHYRARINKYYEEEKRLYALKVLDALAVREQALTFRELFNHCQFDSQTQDRDFALRGIDAIAA